MHRRVLIVDDEQATCELIERTVSTAGMDALVLNNSSQAARALSAGKFDLVFLDFHMSAPDGVELARQVRLTRSNRTTPVVSISDDQRPSVVRSGSKQAQASCCINRLTRSACRKSWGRRRALWNGSGAAHEGFLYKTASSFDQARSILKARQSM